MTKGIDEEKTYADAIVRTVYERGLQRVSADEIGHIAAIAVEYAVSGYELGRKEAIEEMEELTESSSKMNEKKGCTYPSAIEKQQSISQCTITVNTAKPTQEIAGEIMAELNKRIKGGALA